MATAQQAKVNLAGAYAAFQRRQQSPGNLAPNIIEYQAPARMRQLDTLLHLSHFSDYLVLLTAPAGSGKSIFAQQFLRVQPTDTCVVQLTPEETLSGPRLVREIVAQLPIEVPKHASLEQSILALQDLSMSLAANDQILLLVIDDAHWLADDALELLANVIPHSAPADARPHVVLFAEPVLVERFETPQFNELRQERFYQLTLAPFSQADSREFLRQLVADLGLPGDADIHAAQLDQLHEMAKGVPGYLDMLMRQALSQGGLQNAANGLPVWHISAIALVLVALLSLWWLNREVVDEFDLAGHASVELGAQATAFPEPVSSGTLKPLPVLEPLVLSPEPEFNPRQPQEVEAATEVLPVAEGLVDPQQQQQIDDLLQQSEALHEQLQQAAVQMSQVSPEATLPVPQQAVVTPQSEPVASVQPATIEVAKRLNDIEQRFMALPKEHYSLQVLGARYEATAKQFLTSLGAVKLPVYVLELERGGEPWFVVLVGDFVSQRDARNAIENLPQKVRNLQPWARPVTKLQQQLVNKINAGGE
ncbi:MAG TPA: hypothetical protein DE179_07575 [Oceanospirillaceae bacterium]|nr:hypothetical protein [Oceanospirillaceae bacterium]